jgi:hypothetical protein
MMLFHLPSVALCIARGPAPGGEMYGSTRILAQRQLAAAQRGASAARVVECTSQRTALRRHVTPYKIPSIWPSI